MKLHVTCLGAGYFAQFHHDAWQRIDQTELRAVCDTDLSKAQTSGATAYDDLASMLDETRPDIVDIATPPPTHADAIRTALAYTPRVIICQKPFATSLEEARVLTKLAHDAQIPLVIHENFRFQPWYRVMKTAIQDGQIGDVLQTTFRLRTGDGQGPDAYLDRQPYFQTMPRLLIHETGVHFVDVFRFLMGAPKAVYGDLRRMNPVISGEDAGYFLLSFESGARALFDGNRLLDHAAENHRTTLGEALIEGTTGTLSLDGRGSVHLRHFGKQEQQVLLSPQEWPGFGGDCVHALCVHIVEGLTSGTGFENEACDYLGVIEITEAIYRSDKQGRRIEL